MGHVVLLGDSVFDNGAYVGRGGPDVVRQLRDRLPAGWGATLAAVDGAMTGSVPRQLERLPPGATHLVVSVGGNDALGARTSSARGALGGRGPARPGRGARRLRARLPGHARGGARRGLPTALCTVYDPRFPDPRGRGGGGRAGAVQRLITREAFARGLPLVDLRLVCAEDADYANPIEPSVRGGAKIAGAIAGLVTGHDFARRRSGVFARGG